MRRSASTILSVTLLAALLAAMFGLTGCEPSSSSSALDEEREPHFRTGKSRLNSLDYAGAIEAFEKAIEVNPRSASAHFELGLLFESQQQDYAAAIYHYDRYLKLRPNAENAELIRSHALSCKQEIARTVLLAPVQQNMQRDLERATEDNRQLRQKLDAWQSFYSNNAARLNMVPGPAIPQTVPQSNPNPVPPQRGQTPGPTPHAQPTPNIGNPGPMVTPLPPPRNSHSTTVLGTYVLKSGDTPASVARKYGVKLDALLAANPGLDAKHLRVGQTLSIPAK